MSAGTGTGHGRSGPRRAGESVCGTCPEEGSAEAGEGPPTAGSPGRTATSGERPRSGTVAAGHGPESGQVPGREDSRGLRPPFRSALSRGPRRALDGSRGQGRRRLPVFLKPSVPQREGQRVTRGRQAGRLGSTGAGGGRALHSKGERAWTARGRPGGHADDPWFKGQRGGWSPQAQTGSREPLAARDVAVWPQVSEGRPGQGNEAGFGGAEAGSGCAGKGRGKGAMGGPQLCFVPTRERGTSPRGVVREPTSVSRGGATERREQSGCRRAQTSARDTGRPAAATRRAQRGATVAC